MKITFEASLSGKSYFEVFVDRLAIRDQAIILAVFKNISSHGLNGKGCDFRQIERKLWEIKIRAPTGGYRFFYVLLNQNHMHVLHFYKKQGQKAPRKELEIARKRMRGIK